MNRTHPAIAAALIASACSRSGNVDRSASTSASATVVPAASPSTTPSATSPSATANASASASTAPPAPDFAPALAVGGAVVLHGGAVNLGTTVDEKTWRLPEHAATVAGVIDLLDQVDAAVPRSRVLTLGGKTIYPPTCRTGVSATARKTCADLQALHASFMESVVLVAKADVSPDLTVVVAQASTAGNVCYGGGPLLFLRVARGGEVVHAPPLDHCMGDVELRRDAAGIGVRMLEHDGRGPPPGMGEPPHLPEERARYDLATGEITRT